MAFPVVRVCVTIVSLLQSNFLSTRVSSYGCNLCVLNITCGQIFTVLRYLGHLEFLECFGIFFWFFFWRFFHGAVCLSSFVFPRAFLLFFSQKNWKYFGVALHCCLILMCQPVRLWLFKFFSMPTTRLMLNNRLADLLPAPSMSAPPFSGDSVAISAVASGPSTLFSNKIAVSVAHALHQSIPSFVAAFRAENLTARFPAWLFPVSRVVF